MKAEDSLSFSDCIPAEKGFVHFFGTRQSPASLINTVQVGQVVSAPPDYPSVVSLKQVHGTDVIVIDESIDVGFSMTHEGDALVTTQPNVLLVVRTADCVPVLVADIHQHVIAAVHAGWRGAVAGVVLETLAVFTQRHGAKKEHLRVGIGPSIGSCCFEVDDPVIRPIKERFPFWSEVLKPISPTHAKVNLKGLIFHQCLQAGISSTAICQSEDCTQCDANRYFSYRREGRVNGTMLSGIMMKS